MMKGPSSHSADAPPHTQKKGAKTYFPAGEELRGCAKDASTNNVGIATKIKPYHNTPLIANSNGLSPLMGSGTKPRMRCNKKNLNYSNDLDI